MIAKTQRTPGWRKGHVNCAIRLTETIAWLPFCEHLLRLDFHPKNVFTNRVYLQIPLVQHSYCKRFKWELRIFLRHRLILLYTFKLLDCENSANYELEWESLVKKLKHTHSVWDKIVSNRKVFTFLPFCWLKSDLGSSLASSNSFAHCELVAKDIILECL